MEIQHIKKAINLHALWLRGANLRSANLSSANLRSANLPAGKITFVPEGN